VRVRAEGITDAAGKQKIITELYERFFKLAFPRVAESLGIVYTPMEVVDFILRAVNDALIEHFGASITDEGVHVLDPFTGTGTFIVRLLQSGLINPEDLLRKYTQELHANELLLMAYYIAAINIEATFHALQQEHASIQGQDPGMVRYESFDGIVLTDTFQMTEDGDVLDTKVFTSNSDRVTEQNNLDIRVILGNPPYSVGQTSGNDNNANQKYPTLDESIRTTYAAQSTATLKNSLYDSYIRAIRWASNRLLASPNGGIVCYVSNGGYIEGNTADGLRKTLTTEFHDIYVYNLRGNQRTAGEQSRKEGGKIFDSGSRNTVAIMLLIKRPGTVTESVLHYKDIGDYLDRKQKLEVVGQATLKSLGWETPSPNAEGDWINQRDPNYDTYPPIAEKGNPETIFEIQSGGLKTNRDAWVFNSSKDKVSKNVDRMIDFYNRALVKPLDSEKKIDLRELSDPTMISWSSGLQTRFMSGKKLSYDYTLRSSTYRPFEKKHVAFSKELNERTGRLNDIFPVDGTPNLGFFLPAPGNSAPPFMCLATDSIVDLGGAGISAVQLFARYAYIDTVSETLFDGPQKRDNITDWALTVYQSVYGDRVTKDDIFYYIYGVLHSPEYRKRYASDLKKQLPRIPQVASLGQFTAFAQAGQELMELHLNYEDIAPYPVTETILPGAPDEAFERFAVIKMKYSGKAGSWDKTRIRYNQFIDIEGIPLEAQDYMLGSRSGLDWILERYQVKTDKASGIVNDPNDWSREHGQPRYIIDLIGRIVALSMTTNRIIDSLPDLEIN